MPLCDPAAGIFGAEGGGEAQGWARAEPGQGCCGGGFGFFHQLLVPSSPDINLCWHPPPPPPAPPSVSPSKSHLCPLGRVWLVTSSFPKWIVLHGVSVCMCWVSIFFSFCSFFFIFSCHLFFVFLNCTYDLSKGLWHFSACSAFYMGKPSPSCSCFKSTIVLHFLSVVFWCTECGCHSSSSALFRSESEKLEPFRVNLSSLLKLHFHFFNTAWVCGQMTYHSVCSRREKDVGS